MVTREHLQAAANYHRYNRQEPLDSFVGEMPQIFMGLHKTLVNHGLKVKAQLAMDRYAETRNDYIQQDRLESDHRVVVKSEIEEYQTEINVQKPAEKNYGKLGEASGAVQDSSYQGLCSFMEIVKKEENVDEIIKFF